MTITLSHGGDTVFASSSPSEEILVGTKDGVACLKRDQGGSNWRIADRWLTDKHIHALITEPVSGTIFAGVYQDTVYASEDGGRSWDRRDKGLTVPSMYCLASARTNGSARIFAGTEPAHLFYSDDLGRSWSELTALRAVDMSAWTFPLEPFDAHTKHITVHPNDPNTLFIGIEQGGLLKSTDGGATFAALPGMDDDVHRTAIDPSNTDQVYLTGGAGIYVTQDGGASWEHRTTTAHEVGGYPECMVVPPRSAGTIFVAAAEKDPGAWLEEGTAGSRISKSTDGGRSWTTLHNGLPDRLRASFQAMILEDWGESFSIFAATVTGEVWASEDGGENWSEIVSGMAPVSKCEHYELI